MKNTLVVVADLACLKAFRLENNELSRTPRLELVEQFDNADAHGKLVDRVSDLSGRGNILYKLKQHGLSDSTAWRGRRRSSAACWPLAVKFIISLWTSLNPRFGPRSTRKSPPT